MLNQDILQGYAINFLVFLNLNWPRIVLVIVLISYKSSKSIQLRQSQTNGKLHKNVLPFLDSSKYLDNKLNDISP